MRHLALSQTLLFSLLLTLSCGCPDQPPDGDVGEVTDDTDVGDDGTGPEDNGETTDGDTGATTGETGETGEPPTMSCSVQIGKTFTAFGPPDDDIPLTPADEPSAHLPTEGFQTNFAVNSKRLPVGTEVRLLADGVGAGTDAVAGDGTVLLYGVDIPVGTTVITVEADDPDGGTISCNAVNFTLETGECAVTLSPAPGLGCVTTDVDLGTPGVQMLFTVTGLVPAIGGQGTPQPCKNSTLHWGDSEENAKPGPKVPLDSAGQATHLITLEEPVDDVEIFVFAVVEGQHPSQNGQSAVQSYRVDTEPPTIALTTKVTSDIGIDDDADVTTEGIQLEIFGTVSGLGPIAPDVTCREESTLADEVTATPNAVGDFKATMTLNQNAKIHEVVCTVADDCGNDAEDSTGTFNVFTTQANIAILAPTEGTVILAANDENPATPGVLDMIFTVDVLNPNNNFTLSVECGPDGGIALQKMGEQGFTAGAGPYVISASIDTSQTGQKVQCQVRDNATNGAKSGLVHFVAAVPAPSLTIQSPAATSVTNQLGVAILGSTTDLDGEALTVSVSGQPAVVIDDAISSGGFLVTAWLTTDGTAAGTPLADGDYTVSLEAADQWGNPACDPECSVDVRYDATAPVFSFDAPAETTLDPAVQADASAVEPGYQTTVTVAVADGGFEAGASVCLSVGGVELDCMEVGDGATTVTWPAVTLQPGVNTLSANGTDAAGNAGVAKAYSVTLFSDAPIIEIIDPAGNIGTLDATYTVTVKVTDADGNLVDPTEISLRKNGVDTGVAEGHISTGLYEFVDVPLDPGANVFQAVASIAAEEGASSPVTVTVKDGPPAITFTSPTNNDSLNAASTECKGGGDACVADVTCSTTNVDEGSEASLSYSCGEGQTVVISHADDTGTVVFPNVTLANNANCTLECSVVDDSTQLDATSGSIAVSVDLTAPQFVAYAQPSVDTLLFFHDQDAADGFQFAVQITLGGIEQGQAVDLTIDWVEKDAQGATLASGSDTLTEVVPANVNDGDAVTLIFDPYDFGTATSATLSATATDAAGNPAGPFTKIVGIISGKPSVRIVLPAYVADGPCDTTADCAKGICIDPGDGTDKACGIGWGNSSNTSILVVPTNIDSGVAVRVCSNHAFFQTADPEKICTKSGEGFYQVTSQTYAGSNITFSLGQDLPSGVHTLVAEAEHGTTWSSSVEQPIFDQKRFVWYDTVQPAVQGFSIPDDANGDSCLNATEGDGTISVSASCTKDGTLNLEVNGQPAGSTAVTANEPATFTGVSLTDGNGQTIDLACSDQVGNISDVTSNSIDVDTTPPVLGFTNPTGTKILADDIAADALLGPDDTKSRDVVLVTDLNSECVSLFSTHESAPTGQDPDLCGGSADVATKTDDGGVATVAYAEIQLLQEGTQSLIATIADSCLNATQVTTDEILVDTVDPTVTLTAPDPADADPGGGGHQLAVAFETGADANDYEIRSQTCTEDFASCDEAVTILGGGTIAAQGAQQVTVTVPLFEAVNSLRITVWVDDPSGNDATDSADITVTVSDCTLAFDGLGDGNLSNLACPSTGEDCDSVELTFQVKLVGACGAVTKLDLYQDDPPVLVDSVAVDGGIANEASFTRQFTHATSLSLDAHATDGADADVASTGGLVITTDLHDPVALFTSPASGAATSWNASDDTSGAEGLQVAVSVSVDDDYLGGGDIVSLDCGGVIKEQNVAVSGTSFTHTFDPVSLADTETPITCTLTAQDANGNSATDSFTYTSDVVAPVALDVSLAVDSARRPAVTLTWPTIAEDDGSYEVRYSKTPISEGSWATDCLATDLLTDDGGQASPPAAADNETYAVTGPDARAGVSDACVFTMLQGGGTWYFGARAKDAAGNWSDVGATSVVATTELALSYASFSVSSPIAGGNFESGVHRIGDVNNDGYDDFAMGRSKAAGVCIFWGGPNLTGLSIAGDASGDGPGYQCIVDVPKERGGSAIAMGDVDGDNLNDFAVAWGRRAKTDARFPEMRIYKGVSPGSLISPTPLLTITGYDETDSSTQFSSGDFNGDGLGDIAIADRRIHANQGSVWVLPGSSAWTPGATADLTSSTDAVTYDILTFRLVGAGGLLAQFGGRMGFVGDVLTDEGASYDDLLIGAPFPLATVNDRQAVLFRGRPIAGPATYAVSFNHNGTSEAGEPAPNDDANSVIVKVDGGTGASYGAHPLGGDFDGDGVRDMLVGSPSTSVAAKTIFIFDGVAVQGAEGGILTVHGGQPPVLAGDGMFTGVNGISIAGAWIAMHSAGNLNDDPLTGAGPLTPEPMTLAYVDKSSTAGGVYLRFNTNDPGGLPYGSFPWLDIKLEDPTVETPNPNFGWARAIGVGDVNGDDRDDLLVGTNGSGYSILFY